MVRKTTKPLRFRNVVISTVISTQWFGGQILESIHGMVFFFFFSGIIILSTLTTWCPGAGSFI